MLTRYQLMNICGMTAECQMGLIEYACYSVQADDG